MSFGNLFMLALFVATVVCIADTANAQEVEHPPSGYVVGEQVVSASQDVANGVSIASYSLADFADQMSNVGCRFGGYALGDSVDRQPSIGNALVALFWRAPAAVVGGSLCATTAVFSVPVKVVGYSFDRLAGNPTMYVPEGRASNVASVR